MGSGLLDCPEDRLHGRDVAQMGAIRRIWDENFQVHGVRKTWRQLNRERVDVARCAKPALALGLHLCRDLGGLVYVAFALDAFARRIAGWRVSRSMEMQFVPDAPEQALRDRHPADGTGLVHHSDKGSQDVSIKYTDRLAEDGIESSVDSQDNALAEKLIGLFKTEVIHRRGPRRSFETVGFSTLECVDWLNYSRLLESIGNLPPAKAEARFFAQSEELAMVA